MKRYEALFTCLASRAVHIEVVASMETDSFIMALQRVKQEEEIFKRSEVIMVAISLGQKKIYPRPSMKWITPKSVISCKAMEQIG